MRHYIFTHIQKIFRICLDEPTLPKPDKKFLREFYKNSLESFEGTPIQKVVLHFQLESEVYILKEYFHHSQKFYRNENNQLCLELYVNNKEELFALVSRYMTDIQILEPIEWRNYYIENLKKAISLYSSC